MKTNEGTVDRVIRIVIGIAIAGAAYWYGIWWLYLIAAVIFITGAIGWCGLYTLLGINTKQK